MIMLWYHRDALVGGMGQTPWEPYAARGKSYLAFQIFDINLRPIVYQIDLAARTFHAETTASRLRRKV